MKMAGKNYRTVAQMKILAAIFFSLYLLGCNDITTGKTEEMSSIGDFTYRMKMTEERLTGNRYDPVFTKDFILADVNINNDDPRRFQNYSGDLSGRYIEALASCNHNEYRLLVDDIVKSVLPFQKSDGRFGDPDLRFSETSINRDHMPLLWGNGRLLVGLLQYYRISGDKKVLDAAVKLGDFFIDIYGEITPGVVKRLEGLGADGIICFTQYVEPLVMLSEATGNPKYAEAASQVYPVLPPRGTLHSHGYLTTLRGILDLYEFDKNPLHFEFVRNAYDDLVNSDDYTIYGSVKEYFGGKGERDEGCSTADFIRLSLHLHTLTGETSYLERAEFALYNALFFNQFFTGDFGHHTIDNTGSKSEIMMAAWWCCTMSGLRAMQIIYDKYFVENKNGQIKINLLLDADYSDDNIIVSVEKGKADKGFHSYEIQVFYESTIKQPVMIRMPSWADEAKILVNNKEIRFDIEDGYILIPDIVNSGDKILLRLKYRKRIILASKKSISVSEVTHPLRGTLGYGPYILAVDNKIAYGFLAEPNDNIVYVNTLCNVSEENNLSATIMNSSASDASLTAWYKHGGYPSYIRTIFRPVSEMTFDCHPYMMVSVMFAPKED